MKKVNSAKDNDNGLSHSLYGFNQPQSLRSLKKADNKKRRKDSIGITPGTIKTVKVIKKINLKIKKLMIAI